MNGNDRKNVPKNLISTANAFEFIIIIIIYACRIRRHRVASSDWTQKKVWRNENRSASVKRIFSTVDHRPYNIIIWVREYLNSSHTSFIPIFFYWWQLFVGSLFHHWLFFSRCDRFRLEKRQIFVTVSAHEKRIYINNCRVYIWILSINRRKSNERCKKKETEIRRKLSNLMKALRNLAKRMW